MENCAIRICKIAGGTQLNKIQLKPVEKKLHTMILRRVCVCVCLCAGVLSCVTCVSVPHALSGLFLVFLLCRRPASKTDGNS